METPKVFESEYRFCLILWEHEPVSSTELVRLCAERLGWKKSTTYTMLRRLCQRGIFENSGGLVKAKMSREQFKALQSEKFIEETFDGSLPRFLAAFSSRKRLSEDEVRQLQELIDRSREG